MFVLTENAFYEAMFPWKDSNPVFVLHSWESLFLVDILKEILSPGNLASLIATVTPRQIVVSKESQALYTIAILSIGLSQYIKTAET